MEKKYYSLCQVPIWHLLQRIKIGARKRASTFEEFKENRNGCIRITVVPLSLLAEYWLGGGLSSFSEQPGSPDDVCEREFTYKLFPEGTHTMEFVCKDGHVEPVNCYGFSALKVAFVSWKRMFEFHMEQKKYSKNMRKTLFKQETEYFTPENGYTLDKGCVYTTIKLGGEDFMRLYVTVSGAQAGAVDEICASEGMRAGQEFLEDINENINFNLKNPLNFSCSPDFKIM